MQIYDLHQKQASCKVRSSSEQIRPASVLDMGCPEIVSTATTQQPDQLSRTEQVLELGRPKTPKGQPNTQVPHHHQCSSSQSFLPASSHRHPPVPPGSCNQHAGPTYLGQRLTCTMLVPASCEHRPLCSVSRAPCCACSSACSACSPRMAACTSRQRVCSRCSSRRSPALRERRCFTSASAWQSFPLARLACRGTKACSLAGATNQVHGQFAYMVL